MSAILQEFVIAKIDLQTAVSDLNVHVCLLKLLRLKFLPFHITNPSFLIEGHPAFKLIVSHVEDAKKSKQGQTLFVYQEALRKLEFG